MSTVTVTSGGTIRQGDTLPILLCQLFESVAVPVVLTDFTVTLNMRNQLNKLAVISLGACNIVNALTGIVSYAWQAGDTDVAGNFECEFVATSSDGVETFPNATFIPITITPAI